jgi:predicted AlkP superfamily phosphohydrolase/phosphomutase
MGTRLLIIAIDALDSRQITKYRNALPTLDRLVRDRPHVTLRSVMPPDSDTAWASVYTGLNPAQHGVVHFEDPLEKSARKMLAESGNDSIRGLTFWDVASRQGRRVCVLFPHLGFPVWPVNGVMIGRSAVRDAVEANPPSRWDPSRLAEMNVVKGIPGRKKKEYLRKNERLLAAQFAFAEELLAEEAWDLFFVYSSILDMIQHYFWNLCDPSDPEYPGENPFQDAIKNFYILHDRAVERLLAGAGSQSEAFLVSDHGHGMRPTRLFNTNEFLRRQGLLTLRGGAIARHSSRILEKTKRAGLEAVGRFGAGQLVSGVLRYGPWIRRLYTHSLSVDWEASTAYATNLSGVKAYSYNGIVLARERLGPAAYEGLRDSLIRELSDLTDPATGERIVEWIRRREDLYAGPYLSRYPHLLFELRAGWGGGMTPDGSLFAKNNSRSLVPGSHTSEGAVFLPVRLSRPAARAEMTLMDMAPTALDVLGIDPPPEIDGVSLFRGGGEATP